jgi:hypothetical protein
MLKGVTDFLVGGRANVFSAQATITAPQVYTSAAGIGGPLLYNGSGAIDNHGVTAYILAMTYSVITASTVAGVIGLGGGVTSAPTSTTAIGTSGNLRFNTNAPAPLCTPYAIGTVSNAPSNFIPVGPVNTGTLVNNSQTNLEHLGGLIELSPGEYISVCASATLSSAVIVVSLIWAECQKN